MSALDESGGRGFVQRWLRRAITVPLFLLLFPLWLLALPLSLPATALGDLLSNRRWLLTRSLFFFGVYFLCEALGIVAAFLIWLLSGVWAGGSRQRFLDWNYRLQTLWGSTLARSGLRLFDLRLQVEGEEAAAAGGPILLFIRHASLADTVLAVLTLSAPHGYRLRYVLKHRLLWDPCLDIVGQRLPNWFARHGTMRSREEIARVASLADALGPDDGVLIYPEGTRFSAAKKERVLAGLERRGDTEGLTYARSLLHVLPPRQGGPFALLARNAAGSRADALFCAHTGFEGTATLRQIANGELLHRDVHLRFWRVAFAEIPTEAEAQQEWLREQWRQVDDFVEERLPATYVRRERSRVAETRPTDRIDVDRRTPQT